MTGFVAYFCSQFQVTIQGTLARPRSSTSSSPSRIAPARARRPSKQPLSSRVSRLRANASQTTNQPACRMLKPAMSPAMAPSNPTSCK